MAENTKLQYIIELLTQGDTKKARLELSPAALRAALAAEARTLGFDCVGVTEPDAIADAARHFQAFLDSATLAQAF